MIKPSEQAVVDGLVIAQAGENDEAARQAILNAATQELRRIYRPLSHSSGCSSVPTAIFVAKENGVVLGTLACVIREDDVYVQELAVLPAHRRRGVCRALIHRAVEMAASAGLNTVALRVIEETGNVAIFRKLGFNVSKRSIAQGHIGADGASVTQAEMMRIVTASGICAHRSE
jgi:ribosomal protein S18 acetylase RimI-like enzyme